MSNQIDLTKTQPESSGGGYAYFHAYLVLDGSGSMSSDVEGSDPKVRKSQAVAKMVQTLINRLFDKPDLKNTQLSVLVYDSDENGKSRVDVLFSDYNVKLMHRYMANPPESPADPGYDQYDPLTGHGGGTPIGAALREAREMAERWVATQAGITRHRAVIYLMTDGDNNGLKEDGITPDDGTEEVAKIAEFNKQNEATRGRIRVATVGYFQNAKDQAKGEPLLRKLACNPRACFLTADAEKIAKYVTDTFATLA